MNTIGLDIGGTKITGILFDGKKILKELTIVTPKNLQDFKKSILKLSDFLSAYGKIDAVGIGMAGFVDSEKGIVKYSPNIPYIKNLNLTQFFKSAGYKDIKIDNDANCFARAELILGQGKNLQNFLAVTLGTGIGGGIVINHNIYRGQGNAGAEFGHISSGGKHIEKSFQKARDSKNYKAAGLLIGEAFASLINIFSPQAIIIGGSYGINESPKYLPTVKKEIKGHLFYKNSECKILISKLKNAGALGAALLSA